ncbi:putative ubiquitinyl hydrolase 1 [Dioscorea sansibarensis]
MVGDNLKLKPYSGAISIAASARRIDVDNRFSLRLYYRIADNLIKQANIYREENNIIDLYIMLLRFSSLITETIPNHRDYQVSLQREKLLYRKKLLNVLDELEVLKPDVRHKLEELNGKSRNQATMWVQPIQNISFDSSFVWPPAKKQTSKINEFSQVHGVGGLNGFSSGGLNGFSSGPVAQHDKLSQSKFVDRKFSLSIPRATEETLSRHSILGPNGLHGEWRPTIVNREIKYPSNLDMTPIEVPSLNPPTQEEAVDVKGNVASEKERSVLEEVLSLHDDGPLVRAEELSSTVAPDIAEVLSTLDIIKEPSVPPVRAQVEDLITDTLKASNSSLGDSISLQDELARSETPLEVHISTTMMESFMRLAKSNTDRNLETCGVLAGSLKNRKFFVTALIVPKQESTSDSCQTTDEEEIFDYQDKQSLFPLGWIHTHPTQSCFMSSIDVHTHYSYQIMLPEAIAIVMAPRDGSRTHGIFRLTTPGGMSVIRKCPHRGFHPHENPPDGGRIYDQCSNVYMNPNLKFDVVDFR